jgi:rfaE bifunctional protein nucleotidyltransferase chain/domain
VREKVKRRADLKAIAAKAKTEGKKIVFTNGCFDLLHVGHLHILKEAKKLGDVLIVALNSDSSVKLIKGVGRPILPESERAELIAALEMVDYVTLFDEPDPQNVIQELKPDVLAKGGDWAADKIIGREFVESYGGKVAVISYLKDHSTTDIIDIIERMRKQ